MFWLKRTGILVTVAFLMVTTMAISAPDSTQRLTNGTWGGTHIRIEIEGDSAIVEYDCANGTIKGPLTMGRNGEFTWKGVHYREHGGPVRLGETPEAHDAVYSGSIKENTMTLTVKLDDSDQALGPFTLKKGHAGRVFKCR